MKKSLFRVLLVSLLTASMALPLFACDKPETPQDTDDHDTETEVVTEAATPVDPTTFGDADIVYDCDDGSVLSTYNQKTSEDYAGVCAFYEKEGYTVYSSTDMGGNPATTYVKGDAMAHVYFHPSNGELNVVLSDTAGATLPPATPAVTDGDTVCSVVQLEDATHVNGMGYVIQLKDGSYIVYDGSYTNQHSELKSYITKNHKGDGLPIIRAWIMTHSHNDHYPTFQTFCKITERKPYATVEYFIYAPLRDEDYDLNEEEIYLSTAFHEDFAKLDGTKLVYAHTGMEFKFCNLSMEILYSPESYYKTTNEKGNFNNTSIVSRLYGDGYSALFTGDVGIQGSTIMETLYGDYLKSDICQISHHGVEDVPLSFYEKVQASILFYPCDKSLYDQTERHWEERRDMETWTCTKEILIAGLGQYVRTWGTTFEADAPLSVPDHPTGGIVAGNQQ